MGLTGNELGRPRLRTGAIRKDDWFPGAPLDRLPCMRPLMRLLLVLVVPLGLAAAATAEEKKPSLIYYYFDG